MKPALLDATNATTETIVVVSHVAYICIVFTGHLSPLGSPMGISQNTLDWRTNTIFKGQVKKKHVTLIQCQLKMMQGSHLTGQSLSSGNMNMTDYY